MVPWHERGWAKRWEVGRSILAGVPKFALMIDEAGGCDVMIRFVRLPDELEEVIYRTDCAVLFAVSGQSAQMVVNCGRSTTLVTSPDPIRLHQTSPPWLAICHMSIVTTHDSQHLVISRKHSGNWFSYFVTVLY